MFPCIWVEQFKRAIRELLRRMETPIANVSVSDGRNVVKTDENGKFFLKDTEKPVL